MKETNLSPRLIYEEKKALKLFLWLFYIFYISYELAYYYIFPFSNSGVVFTIKPREGLGIWIYLILFSLLPISIYLNNKGNLYIIKYLYIYSFLFLDLIHNLIIYLGTNKPFGSGHIVEVLFILFSPIFVNKRYFWTVSIGMILKYSIFFLVLMDTRVIFPMIIYIILCVIAFIILSRFDSYINSLNSAHLELRQKEKLAVIGQMAAGIGHEIRNPLSSLKGFTQLQKERFPNTNDFYPIMIAEIDRINTIVNDLMYLGKPKDITFVKANIEEIIAYTLSITQQQTEKQAVTITTFMFGPIPPLDCDPHQLKQVFINLIKNAIESMPEGGEIKISVKVLDGKKMYISIQDEGCGIEEDSLPNLGEPFFTTKIDGTGLGLMVTNQIIKDHKGKINIESSPSKGTKVYVTLPVYQN